MRRIALALLLGFAIVCSARAQTPLDLSDPAVREQLEIEIAGVSFDGLDYAQPTLSIRLRPTNGTPMTVSLAEGTELIPIDDSPAMVALELAPNPLTLDPNEPTNAGIVAFTTAPALHPRDTARYQIGAVTTDASTLETLARIRDAGNYNQARLAPQVALWWRLSPEYPDFSPVDDQIESIFGVSLEGTDAQQEAASLAGIQPTTDPNTVVATATAAAAPTGATAPTSASVPTPGSEIPPVAGGAVDAPQSSVNILLLFGMAMIAALALFFLVMRSTPRVAPAPVEQPERPAASGGPQTTPSASATGSPIGTPRERPREAMMGEGLQKRRTEGQRRQGGTAPMPKPGDADLSRQPRAGGSAPPVAVPMPTPAEPSQARAAGAASAVESNGRTDQAAPSPQGTNAKPDATHAPAAERISAVRTAAFQVDSAEPEEALKGALYEPSIMLLHVESGQEIPIYANTMITGRRMKQTVIQQADVSSPHCTIRFLDTGWCISDLHSRNKTRVNGNEVTLKDYPIQSGQVVQLGSLRLLFNGDEAGRSATLTEEGGGSASTVYRFEPERDKGLLQWLITYETIAMTVLDSSTVSTPHAFISFDDGWTIRDLRSTNGTSIMRSTHRSPKPIKETPKRLLINDVLHLSKVAYYRFAHPHLPNVGPYTLTEWTGWGGMASVFRAQHSKRPAQEVVLKLLATRYEHAPESFQHEAEIMRRLGKHEHIVPFIDFDQDRSIGDDPPGLYLVLGYIHGATLRAILRAATNTQLPLPAVLKIAFAVCDALDALHTLGYVHCDIKPDNIMIGMDGRTYVADFGSATKVQDHPSFGTHRYLPAEIMERTTAASPATDIWSIGAVLHECLTGTQWASAQRDVDRGSRGSTSAIRDTSPATAVLARESNVAASGYDTIRTVISNCTAPLTTRIKTIGELRAALDTVRRMLPESNLDGVDLGIYARQVDVYSEDATTNTRQSSS